MSFVGARVSLPSVGARVARPAAQRIVAQAGKEKRRFAGLCSQHIKDPRNRYAF